MLTIKTDFKISLRKEGEEGGQPGLCWLDTNGQNFFTIEFVDEHIKIPSGVTEAVFHIREEESDQFQLFVEGDTCYLLPKGREEVEDVCRLFEIIVMPQLTDDEIKFISITAEPINGQS